MSAPPVTLNVGDRLRVTPRIAGLLPQAAPLLVEALDAPPQRVEELVIVGYGWHGDTRCVIVQVTPYERASVSESLALEMRQAWLEVTRDE